MTELRDLEADRRLTWLQGTIQLSEIMDFSEQRRVALAAALDEIDRLKGLIVFEVKLMTGGVVWRNLIDDEDHPTEADAWAAVRKAALDATK